MATVVIMPRQGQSVEHCILTGWYKEVGDQVKIGDLLFSYETDKAAFDEEARAEGILIGRFYEAGEEVKVLQNVAVIGEQGEPVAPFLLADEPARAKPDGSEIEEPDQVRLSEVPVSPAPAVPGKRPVSPRARRLAREKRVILEGITGSGPGGRIIESDVLNAIADGKRMTPLARKKMLHEGLTYTGGGKTPRGRIFSEDLVRSAPAEADGRGPGRGDHTDEPVSHIRRIIAGAMHRSLQHSAQLTHHLGANASGMLNLRKEVKRRVQEGYAFNITLNDMVCHAVIRALGKHPRLNAHFLGETIRRFHRVNLGLAVDTDRGLMVPTLLDADQLSLQELSVQLKSLADQAREGRISPDLLVPESASFTVSNLGHYGVEMFTPVINLPQVAILGVNTILHRPALLPDGTMEAVPFVGLSLTYDHRAVDGGPATQFLAEIRNEIEKISIENFHA